VHLRTLRDIADREGVEIVQYVRYNNSSLPHYVAILYNGNFRADFIADEDTFEALVQEMMDDEARATESRGSHSPDTGEE
jgi:translation elongation factor EF-Ts